MRVLLTQQISGARDGQPWPAPGNEIDLPDAEARALLTGGNAVEAGTKAHGEKVLVPPAGVHTPGRTALDAGEQGPPLVEAPADALSDPEGAKQAYRDAQAGNWQAGPPVEMAHQDRTGLAFTREQLDDAEQAERQTREVFGLPQTGPGTSEQASPSVTPAEPKAPAKAADAGKAK